MAIQFNLEYPVRTSDFDLFAEQALLGCILKDSNLISLVQGKISEGFFYGEKHQLIFRCLIELYEEQKEIDELSLGDQLSQKGALEKVGGYSYITEMMHSAPIKMNVGEYVDIVRNYYFYRRILKFAKELASKSQDKAEKVESLLFEMEQQIVELRGLKEDKRLVSVRDVVQDAMDAISLRAYSTSKLLGVETGFLELDDITLGLQPSDLIIVAARPSMGKTAFALNIASHLALHQGQCVYFFSLEMSKQQLAFRLFSAEVEVPGKELRMGKLKQPDWDKLMKKLNKIKNAPLYICDISGLSIAELHALAKANAATQKPAAIVVDYLQLLRSSQKYPNREQEISEISRSLKALAKDLNVPVIALSQLNRAPDARSNKRPLMSDIRESGSIEQDADVIMFLYRDEVYHPETVDKGTAEVIIAKHRNGEIGTKKLAFVGAFTKFSNLALDTLGEGEEQVEF